MAQTALLNSDAFGEYFHLGAAMLLDNSFNGFILHVSRSGSGFVTLPQRFADMDLLTAGQLSRLHRQWTLVGTSLGTAPGRRLVAAEYQLSRDVDAPVFTAAQLPAFPINALIQPAAVDNFTPESTRRQWSTFLGPHSGWSAMRKETYKPGNATTVLGNVFALSKASRKAGIARIRQTWLLPAFDPEVRAYANRVLPASIAGRKKLIIWARRSDTDPYRNMTPVLQRYLLELAFRSGIVPLLFGEIVGDGGLPDGVVDLRNHSRDPVFNNNNDPRSFAKQLYLFELLRREHNLIGIIGAKSGFLDGCAFIGIPLVSLVADNDSGIARLKKLAAPVLPHYFLMPMRGPLKKHGARPITLPELVSIQSLIMCMHKLSRQNDSFPTPDQIMNKGLIPLQQYIRQGHLHEEAALLGQFNRLDLPGYADLLGAA